MDTAAALQQAAALHRAGQWPQARALYQQVLQQQPGQADALHLLGVLTLQQGDAPQASALLQQALQAQPGHAPAWTHLGVAYKAQGRLPQALACHQRALALQPGLVDAHVNLGNVLHQQGRHEQALAAYRQALQHAPGHAQALASQLVVLMAQGRWAQAEHACRHALQAAPEDAELQFQAALLHLLLGQGARGWALYEARWRRPAFVHRNPVRFDPGRCWDGRAPVQGRRLLLLSEQGLGDAIQFARLALLLAQGGAQVVMETPAPLLRLMQAGLGLQPPGPVPPPSPALSPDAALPADAAIPPDAALSADATLPPDAALPTDAVPPPAAAPPPGPAPHAGPPAAGRVHCLPKGAPLPEADFHLPLLSLPGRLQGQADALPPALQWPGPYLQPPQALASHWAAVLNARLGPRPAAPGARPAAARIGLVWKAGDNPDGLARHLPAPQLAQALAACPAPRGAPAPHFISLQKDVQPEEAQALHAALPGLVFTGPEQADLADAAAIIQALDLVISVDTSIAHLAGAMGKPVWVLLPALPDWRWQLARGDSPWYPTARLFRQPTPGDWGAVLGEVTAELGAALQRAALATRAAAGDGDGDGDGASEGASKGASEGASECAGAGAGAGTGAGAGAWAPPGGAIPATRAALQALAQGRLHEAHAQAQQALAASPGPDAMLHNNLAVVLHALGRHAQAVAAFEQALAIAPGFRPALINRAGALRDARQWPQAEASLDEALASDPRDVAARWNKALLLLLQGQYARAWPLFECRWEPGGHCASLRRPQEPPRLPLPGWPPAPGQESDPGPGPAPAPAMRHPDAPHAGAMPSAALHPAALHPFALHAAALRPGQRLLVTAEQGLGDTLQFARYLPLLAQRGLQVVAEVQPTLVRLLAHSLAAPEQEAMQEAAQKAAQNAAQEPAPLPVQVVPLGPQAPPADACVGVMSLAALWGTAAPQQVPCSMPYLRVPPALHAHWRQRIAAQGDAPSPLVGLMWRGNPQHAHNGRRSVALDELLSALPTGPRYLSLHKDLPPEDLAWLATRPDVLHLGDAQQDMLDAAALCECCSLVVTVDTSMAHLAGALGRPTWVLLHASADWRWGLHGAGSAWYPSVRLFRQSHWGDWREPLQALSQALGPALAQPASSARPTSP